MINFALMKETYRCKKESGCELCKEKTDSLVISSLRNYDNDIYFCRTPEVDAVKKEGSGAWKKKADVI